MRKMTSERRPKACYCELTTYGKKQRMSFAIMNFTFMEILILLHIRYIDRQDITYNKYKARKKKYNN